MIYVQLDNSKIINLDKMTNSCIYMIQDFINYSDDKTLFKEIFVKKYISDSELSLLDIKIDTQ